MFSETDLDIFQAEFSRKLDGDKRARFDLDRVSNLTRVHVYTEVYSHKNSACIKKKIIKLQKDRQEDRNILRTQLCTELLEALNHNS